MSSHHILIVDDQRDVRQMLRAGLETLGQDIRVTDVPSGEEAMLIISNQPVDLIVVDVRLPGISGLELKQQALAYNPCLKLILITGLVDPNLRQQVAGAGAEAFFFKPVELPEFLDAAGRCLGLGQSIFRQPPPGENVWHAPQRLLDRLDSLRRDLNLTCAAILDERGRLLSCAGDLPFDSNESGLIPALLEAFTAGARVARAMDMKSPQDLLYFQGVKFDLFLAHVGLSKALLSVIPVRNQDVRLGEVHSRVRAAVLELLTILGTLDVPVQPEADAAHALLSRAAEADPGGDLAAPDLDAVLRQAFQNPYRAEDVDSYWGTLAEDASSENNPGPGVLLSYDQALQLGLAPEDGR